MGRNIFHDVEDFRVLLGRERARTDRTGRAFSVVLVQTGCSGPGGKGLGNWNRSLATLLIRRMRTIDLAGWYDRDRLGVLLPETPEAGVRKFAADFAAEALPLAPALTYEVLSYSSTPPARTSAPAGEEAHPEPAARGDLLKSVVGPLPWWKRVLDAGLAAFLLAALSPLFLALAVYLKVVSPGPVFYRHQRVGRLGRPFTMWKFRTMRTGCDTTVHREHLKGLIHGQAAMGKLDAQGRDPRLIPLAGLLRRSCVDELPQLFNVLRGEMSLVGPRPCLPYEAAEYSPWHWNRFDALPGMTGLWQVSGKNRTTFRQMMEFDIRYGRRISLARDLVIIARTPLAILLQVWDAVRAKLARSQPFPAGSPGTTTP